MIVSKAPLRISLGGGGTDVAPYYSKFGSQFISMAINQYVYIALHRTYSQEYILKYSEVERVKDPAHVEHPILRAALERLNIGPGIEIATFSDVPGGTGLGSSSSFTVALLAALLTHKGLPVSPQLVANLACEIEIDILKQPIGKQDQFISAYGGVTGFKINTEGLVSTLSRTSATAPVSWLAQKLVMFDTGISRSASEVLGGVNYTDPSVIENLHKVKSLGATVKGAIDAMDAPLLGQTFTKQWQLKTERSDASSAWIKTLLEVGMAHSHGGKLIGAGGGGFLLFASDNRKDLINAMAAYNTREVPVQVDTRGVEVVLR